MSAPLALLVAAILLFAALLVTHAVLLRGILRSELSQRWKLFSFVPFVTPVAAWKASRRKSVMIWVTFLTLYLVVRLTGG